MSSPAGHSRHLEVDRVVQRTDTAGSSISASTVVALFERQVQRFPDRFAIAFAGERLSYRDLDIRSNRLAHALRTLGVGRGVLVGICMERSLETALGVLGILKAGGAYVPLDPEYPHERLQFMLEDTHAPIVLTDERAARHVPKHDGQTIELGSNSARAMLAGGQATPLAGGAARPEDLAYVIYTSGSTGKSKGVAMPHAALSNLVAWQMKTSQNPTARTLQFASMSFDVSFQEMFSTWCAGGELLLLSEESRRDSAALWGLLQRESIERLFLPFVALQHLAEAAETDGSDAPSLREVITAGEQLRITPEIARLFSTGSSRILQNQYGPSESHVVTAFTLRGSPEEWPTLPPIGRPIANSRVYVLDGNRQPVPAGAEGEIYIGGVGLARGYWNRPELTAEKFVPDPFGFQPGGRLYRSGDLGRCRADGEIEFLGRSDDQVKIRGYRVEPGEVAAALGRHPEVRETVAVGREDPTGAKALVAYVVSRGSRPPSVTELRTFLKSSLPEYMVPSAFVFLDALPATPSGKIDHRALPPPGSARSSGSTALIPPRDPSELRLAAIWERILGIRPIGVTDDFFDLGGHSLLAARMFGEIQKAFGSRLSASALLQAPTIEKLAARLRGGEEATRWTSLVPITPGSLRRPLFCMHAGAGTILFYSDLARELGPDQPVYGLQAQGLYGHHPPHKRVEEMAAHYLHEIRAVQPRGPYALAGFCFGAILAFEMSQQLRQQGEEVALLASFDGGRPGYDTYLAGLEEAPREPAEFVLRSKVRRHWRNFRRRGPAYLFEKAWARTIAGAKTLEYGIGRRLAERGRPLPPLFRERFFLRNSWCAEDEYRPRPYEGRMVVFSTSGRAPDPTLGWKDLVLGAVEVHPIAGDHRSHRDLLEGKFVPKVAARLRVYLA